MEDKSNGFWGFLRDVLSDKLKTDYGKINYKFGLCLLIIGVIYLIYQYKMSMVYLTNLGKEFELLTFHQIMRPAYVEIFVCLIYIGFLAYNERSLKKKSSLW